MYFELGQENFQSSITSASVNHIQVQVQSKFRCDDLGIKCQCINDHYQFVSIVVLYHSTINPQVELNCTEKIETINCSKEQSQYLSCQGLSVHLQPFPTMPP